MAGLLYVLYGKKDGTYRKAEVLKGTDGEPLILPGKGEETMTDRICTRPFAVDWDGDGKLDLVVGNFAGTFFWFKGEGKGKFAPKAERIDAEKAPLKIPGVHSDPFVIDWDGDGDLDIVSGSSDGGVYWAENTAGKGQPPVLKQCKALVPPGKTSMGAKIVREEDLKRPNYGSRVWVADVNGDGKLDLLVGDSVTLVSPAKGLSEEEFAKQYKAWEDAASNLRKELGNKPDEEKRKKYSQEFQKLYQKRTEIMKEEMTGFVWLYLQK
jgi:hypothetical protein